MYYFSGVNCVNLKKHKEYIKGTVAPELIGLNVVWLDWHWRVFMTADGNRILNLTSFDLNSFRTVVIQMRSFINMNIRKRK
jgi:hypothetical protein